jgi:hypothetical protein
MKAVYVYFSEASGSGVTTQSTIRFNKFICNVGATVAEHSAHKHRYAPLVCCTINISKSNVMLAQV